MNFKDSLTNAAGLLRNRTQALMEMADYLEAMSERDGVPEFEVGWSTQSEGWLAFYAVPDVMGAARELALFLGEPFEKRVNKVDGDLVAHCSTLDAPLYHLRLEGAPGPSCTVERIVKGTKTIEDVEYKVTGCDEFGPVLAG